MRLTKELARRVGLGGKEGNSTGSSGSSERSGNRQADLLAAWRDEEKAMHLDLRLFVWLWREQGQDLVEYALILGLVALTAVGAIAVAGGEIGGYWDSVLSRIVDLGLGLP